MCLDMAVVGYVTLDYIKTRHGAYGRAIGGTSTYAGFSINMLGFKVGIVSTVGFDLNDAYILRLARVMDVSRVKKTLKPTTKFELSYLCGKRVLRLLDLCEPIGVDALKSLEAKAVLMGPVAGEIGSEVLEEVSSLDVYRALSLQGFLRRFKEDGSVELKFNEELLKYINKFNLVCGSSEEVRVGAGIHTLEIALRRLLELGVDVATATLGSRGPIVASHEGFLLKVPAYLVGEVDPTGAGDVYAGVLALCLSRGEDPKWAACIATSAASFVVEGLGSSRFGSRQEVEERASTILEKVKVQPL